METPSTNQDNLNDIRKALREREISIGGRRTQQQIATQHKLESDFPDVFNSIFELKNQDTQNPEQSSLADVLRLIQNIAKRISLAVSRYNEKEKTSAYIIPEEIDQEMYALIELFNENAMPLRPHALLQAMTYHGLKYWEEFFQNDELRDFYKDKASEVNLRIETDPMQSVKHLSESHSTFKELCAEEKFKEIAKEHPWVIWRILSKNKDNPEKALEKYMENLQALLKDTEVNSLSPWVIRHVCAHKPDLEKAKAALKMGLKFSEANPNRSYEDMIAHILSPEKNPTN